MAHFASEAELEAFLGELNPTYGQYATALWSNGITTQRQLANADKEDLLAAGVTSAIHATDIKATAGTQGQVQASRSCLGLASACCSQMEHSRNGYLTSTVAYNCE